MPDLTDLYPCDAAAAGQAFAPSQLQHGLLEFEDEWPQVSDLDFDDVVVSYNYAVKTNASGDAVSLLATYNVLALGGVFDHGFALQLPVAASQVSSVTRTIGAGTPAAVLPRSLDINLTFDVVPDLRTLFAGQSGQINSQPGQPTLTAQPVQIEVVFTQPVSLPMAQAPFDSFIFRVNAPGHEIHRVGYPGSAAMNTGLFGSGVDGSAPGRYFVDNQGLPYALTIPEVAPYPQEGVVVSSLFPDILGFAASAGASNADFYKTNVNLAFAYAGAVAPSFALAPTTPDRSCVPVFSASGGIVTEIDGGRHTVHTFTANGTFDATGTPQEVEVLLVGGGGSGGGRHGGGGGGGGVLQGTLQLSAQTYAIAVGAGGAPVVGTGVAGNDGQATSAFGATALGGGGGGAYSATNGRAGGSGGGGGHSSTVGGAATQGDSAGLRGYGNPGADNPSGGNEASGGGGAGADDAVAGAAESAAGRGGSGYQSNIDGNNYYYAGGGGGGGWGNDGGHGGIGGGGGGNTASGGTPGSGGGSARNPGQAGQAAASPAVFAGGDAGANTGGGGGGSGQADHQGWMGSSGAGGSGIVIVKYPTPGFPLITFSAGVPGVVHGHSATLSWSVTDASACVASGDWTGPKPVIGTQDTGPMTSPTTYTLTCTGTRGTTVKTVSLGVGRAFGGQISRVGNYIVHTFKADGVFDVVAPELDIEVLMVGGGGSGGGRHGGGGGGGGVLAGSMSVARQAHAIVIGAGGAAVVGTSIAGNNGQDTTAFGATALGGGGGGAYSGVHGRSGGSGGGAGHSATVGGAATQTDSAGLVGYGNPGADNPSAGNEASGGGGAGANDAVAGIRESTGGRGGSGFQSNIDGNNYYYAGGGGGGGWGNQGGHGGIGGGGGGNTASGGTPGVGGASAQNAGHDGQGSSSPAIYSGGDGGANTGGGGGGSGQADHQGWMSTSGAGGSGIVIVRYLDPGLPLMSLTRTGSATLIGESVTVAWEVVDATACTASGDWSGPQAAIGSFVTGPLSSDKTYTLTCTNANGSRSKTVDIGVANSGRGGIVSDVGPYRVHTFIADDTFEALVANLNVEVLMVGGGGGGGGRHGGGGGGGGVLTGSLSLNAQAYPLTIGAGGAPVAGTNVAGNNGASSTGFGATALGGGGGGAYNGTHGRAGGSGGGAGHSPTNGGGALQGDSGGLTGHGHPGAHNPSGSNEASGGGGAGANDAVAGVSGSSGGRGGTGLQSNIDGNNYYYAGGGGGGGWGNNGGQGGLGGGGGGNTASGGTPGAGGGSARSAGQSGQAGPTPATYYGGDGGANTGGGGGGSGQASYQGWTSYGGAGGSGIIIVRYLR